MTESHPSASPRELPLGVFDSGVGGLTVLRALREELPAESVLYLGDTARLPYGTKSPVTVSRYALRAARGLVERGIKLLVVACNTASALALDDLQAELGDLPVIGVVRPGAEAAARASASGRIAVLSTESTAVGGAYPREIRALRPEAEVISRACSLFVALAEEGWTEGEIAEGIAREYLRDLDGVDCVVLGCTHFPPLAGVIAKALGPAVTIVDSAATTAVAVREVLDGLQLEGSGPVRTRFLATDAPDRFLRVAPRFLPAGLVPETVELVDL